MIRHILKIIWNERRINGWILLEYIFVFCILWFCVDYLVYMGKSYIEPLGYDTDHTYDIKLIRQYQEEGNQQQEDVEDKDEAELLLTLQSRIKQHPDIEYAAFSAGSVPFMSYSNHANMTVNNDSVMLTVRERNVSTEFFDVFKLKIRSGKVFDWTDVAMKNTGIISPGKNDLFEKYPLTTIHSLFRTFDSNREITIIGITDKIKQNFYAPYEPCVIYPVDMSWLTLEQADITVRVKPGADKDFIERFSSDMKEQFKIGPYELASVTSLKENQKIAMKWDGIVDQLNSVYAITAFLIINIFLAIIGTFWYRTQSRQSEIGLRIALGASGRKVKTMICMETLLLLLIASLVGVNICLNIGQTDILEALGLPMANRIQAGMGFEQDIINYVLTFSFLAVVSLAAVWYPANQAASVQPAEALRNE